jgi:hypothetical protein
VKSRIEFQMFWRSSIDAGSLCQSFDEPATRT